MIVVFVESDTVSDSFIKLNKERYHHLVRVLRISKNEKIKIVCDNDDVIIANVSDIKNDGLEIKHLQKRKKKHLKTIVLVQALTKKDKCSTICDYVTQFGITDIIPIETERSIVKWDHGKKEKMLEKWREKVLHAAMQSEREEVPCVHTVVTFKDYISNISLKSNETGLVCWEEEKFTQMKQLQNEIKKKDKVIFFIGPEGGLSEHEIASLKERKFQVVSLGKNILRVEIASLVALVQLQDMLS